jgi:hypothetical protein
VEGTFDLRSDRLADAEVGSDPCAHQRELGAQCAEPFADDRAVLEDGDQRLLLDRDPLVDLALARPPYVVFRDQLAPHET